MQYIVKTVDDRRLAVCGVKSKAIKLAQMFSWDKIVDIFEDGKKELVCRYAYGKDLSKKVDEPKGAM